MIACATRQAVNYSGVLEVGQNGQNGEIGGDDIGDCGSCTYRCRSFHMRTVSTAAGPMSALVYLSNGRLYRNIISHLMTDGPRLGCGVLRHADDYTA